MTTEGNIQLPPDETGQKVRVFALVEYDPDTGVQYEVVSEAVVLADEDGNLLLRGGLGEKRLAITARDLVERLEQVNQGIAHMVLLMKNTGHPRGPTHAADAWVNLVLGGRRDAA